MPPSRSPLDGNGPVTVALAGWATHAALLVVQMAFAGGAVEGKLAMRPPASGGGGVDPFALAMARMARRGALLPASGPLPPVGSAAAARARAPGRLSAAGHRPEPDALPRGPSLTTAFAAALLGATIPVFTAALAVVLRVEKPAARTAVGLALAFGGVLWLTGVGSLDVGATVIAINCLSYALYIVLAKPVLARVGALTLVTWVFTWGAVMLVPVGALRLAAGVTEWGARSWTLVAFMVACPTIIAYLANAWALERSTPTMVTIYIYLQPLLAALLQWVQMREPLSRPRPRGFGADPGGRRRRHVARGTAAGRLARRPGVRGPARARSRGADHETLKPSGTPKKLPGATSTSRSTRRGLEDGQQVARAGDADEAEETLGRRLHGRPCAATHSSTRARLPTSAERVRSASSPMRAKPARPGGRGRGGASRRSR